MRSADAKRTSAKAAQGRARLVLARGLGWTVGFPDGPSAGPPSWTVPDRSAADGFRSVTIASAEISRAQRAANELRREFPRVLPKLVGDPDAWRARVDAVLRWLKGALHEGRPLPDDLFAYEGHYARDLSARAGRIGQRWPALRAVVSAASWAHAVDQTGVGDTLRWLEEHGDALARCMELLGRDAAALRVVIALARIARRLGPQHVAGLLVWASDPRVHGTALAGGHEYLGALAAAVRRKEAKRGPWPGDRPSAAAIASLLAFVRWLHVQDARTVRRAVQLFDRSAPTGLLAQWDVWWRSVDAACAPVRKLASGVAVPDERLATAAYDFARLRTLVPVVLPLRDYFGCLMQASSPLAPQQQRALAATLAALPDDLPGPSRARFLMHWSRLCAEREVPASRLTHLLDAFRTYLARRRGSSAAWLRPWTAASPHRHAEPPRIDATLVDELASAGAMRRFFDALVCVHERLEHGLDTEASEDLVALVKGTADAARAAAMLLQLHEAGLTGSRTAVLATALRLVEDDAADFAALVRELDSVSYEDRPGLEQLGAAFREAGRLDVLRAMLLSGMGQRVRQAAQRWHWLQSLGTDRDGLPARPKPARELPGWAREYPAELAPAIAAVVAVHDNAERAVVAILRAALPRRADLERELAVLAQRMAAGSTAQGIATRRANLERRLREPPALSADKRDKLRAELERAAQRAIFAAWEQRLETRVAESLCAVLPARELPAWVAEERHLVLLAAIARLDAASRELGLRLLRVRSGPPPWDLRDAPANARFLATLRERGVNVAPWVDGLGARELGGEAGLILQLEDDPLEVMHMGGHFQTCLSPLSFNFFSAVSNAADINKRVLYGRDRQGRVQGRCLLALTDAGGILTFHAYCHDPRRGFPDMVRAFVGELAAAMGVVALPRGVVSDLVAPAWYDDGPVDMSARFACLQEGSALRAALQTVAPRDLLPALRAAFAPLALNELTLPLVVALPEIASRRELVVALVRALRALPRLPEDALVVLVRALVQRGELDIAGELFGPVAEDHLLRVYRRTRHLDHDVSALLLSWSPAALLRVLRATRARGERGWRSESESDRLHFAAEAYRALERPRKAIALYELALAAGVDSDTGVTMRERIAELQLQLRARA